MLTTVRRYFVFINCDGSLLHKLSLWCYTLAMLKYPWVCISLLPSILVWGFEWGIYSHNVCAYVCMYMSITLKNVNLRYRFRNVRTYVSVTLRNVNLWYCFRNVNLRSRSECQFALTPGQDIGYVHYTTISGWRFLVTEEGEDGAAGPLQRMCFVEPSVWTNAERSQRLATLR